MSSIKVVRNSDDFEEEPDYEYMGQYWDQAQVDDVLTSSGLDVDSYLDRVIFAEEISQDYIDAYNEVMDRGDYEEIQEAIEHLSSLYEDGYEPQDYWDEEDCQDMYEANLEVAYNMLGNCWSATR